MKPHFKKEDWHYCHECQIERGGTMDEDLNGITVTHGKCTWCGEEKTLVPNADYFWGKVKYKVWD